MPIGPAYAGVVARIVAIVPDLLLASKVDATLRAAGHDVVLAPDPGADSVNGADALVVDLATVAPEELAGAAAPVLGFYSHVDVETKQRAEAAGLDRVVPRSRLARELPELIAGVLA